MSAQYGRCNFDGRPVDPQDFDQVRPVLAPYGPDGEGSTCKDNFGVFYRAFHTTKESRLENQPSISPSGVVITWDGRLDNRSELIHELGGTLSRNPTDLAIVAAAYEQCGTDSLAKLIGDWAVSIWAPRTQSLVLANDFVGTRHLYYSINKDQVAWCTILDPLILFAGRSLALEEEYIAGWLSFFPAPHLTPYVGVHSVPPSFFVCLTRGKQTISKYWDFDPAKTIRYRTDAEYEQHFRSVFSKAVRRRLRSDSPVLAELSGGVDSSSVVCVADNLIAHLEADTPRLDTISYYNDAEPNWDERSYFTKVEEKRGRAGCHIEVSAQGLFRLDLYNASFAATPGSVGLPGEVRHQFAAYIASEGARAVLSGIGGDEVLGGVPTPIPELEDLLSRGEIITLAHQLKEWALSKRQPWIHLFFEAIRGFLPLPLVGIGKHERPAPWLRDDFVRRNRGALAGYKQRVRVGCALPSFQNNLFTLKALRRQLACETLAGTPPFEKRYPYLDRDLMEFLYSIPREQLVRPGQRRSLMRRALAGIVPGELLNRRRKGFFARTPMLALRANWGALDELARQMVTSSLGIVDPTIVIRSLQAARHGREVPIVFLMRTIGIEMWLRTLRIVECDCSEENRWQLVGRCMGRPRATKWATTVPARPYGPVHEMREDAVSRGSRLQVPASEARSRDQRLIKKLSCLPSKNSQPERR